jgi:predicted nucleotidyltransferase
MLNVKKYTKEDYKRMISKALENVLGCDCVVIFFGSILNERFNRTSDIDVAIFTGKELSGKEYVKILQEIDELPMLREVDIVDLAAVYNYDYLKSIMATGEVWISTQELMSSLRSHLQSLKK